MADSLRRLRGGAGGRSKISSAPPKGAERHRRQRSGRPACQQDR